ncbi:MAG: ribosome biogenesis GTP-binding protein YihA/YsxC [Bacilli bacterium]
MINFSNATFIKSATKLSEAPIEDLPEVLIVGKSNVGKSSLINAMCHRKRLAFTSSKPGHTRLLNYYDIDHRFYLVDAPGYGYARGGVDLDALFGEMMSDFFSDNHRLKLVLILVDSRRELVANDQEIIDYLSINHIPFLMIITKTDKVNQSEKAALLKHLKTLAIEVDHLFFTSLLKPKTLDSVKVAIEKAL